MSKSTVRWRARSLAAAVALLAFTLALLAACSPEPRAGTPALPTGFVEHGVPSVELRGFVYLNTGAPVAISAEALGEEAASLGDVHVHSVSGVLRSPNGEYAARLQLTDSDAATRVYEAASSVSSGRWLLQDREFVMSGRPRHGVWTEDLQLAWTEDEPRSLEEAYPEAWASLRLLPEEPPAQPFATGFVHNVSQIVDDVLSRAGVSVSGLDSALNLMRVDTVGFAAYADDLERLPTQPSRQALRDSEAGVLAVATSGYPGFVVSFLFPRFADRAGLEEARVDDKAVLYRSLDNDLHLMMRNQGATFFFAFSPTKAGAEDLIRSVIASQESR